MFWTLLICVRDSVFEVAKVIGDKTLKVVVDDVIVCAGLLKVWPWTNKVIKVIPFVLSHVKIVMD